MAASKSPYDADHKKARERLLSGAYNTPCPMCRKVMLRGQELDLDHSVPLALDPSSKGDRIVHAACNQSAGGELSGKQLKLRPSRTW